MNYLRIPDDVKHVEGCTCAGGGEIHALDCARVKVYVDQMMGGR